MMAPELEIAIMNLCRNDATLYVTFQSCRQRGLSNVDMLAHMVINLVADKKLQHDQLMASFGK